MASSIQTAINWTTPRNDNIGIPFRLIRLFYSFSSTAMLN